MLVRGVDVKVDILILSFGEIQEANMVSKLVKYCNEKFTAIINITS